MPLLHLLHEAGWHCALPCIPLPPSKTLIFREWNPMQPPCQGRFRIPEPPPESPPVTPEIILVPLLAFDAKNQRLGYGGGYYDTTLEALPEAVSIGCAYDWQQCNQIPAEPHDKKLTLILADANPLR